MKAALDGKTPAEAAKAAVAGTKLQDPAARKALLDGGEAAVAASTDSMIVLARRIDPLAREIRRFLEDEVDAPTTRAMEKIAQARLKVYGRTVSPDATFTLRLSYGTVKGFPAEGTRSRPSPPSTGSSTARCRTAARRRGSCRRAGRRSCRRSTARCP